MPRCEMRGEWPDCPWKTDPEIMCGEFHPKPITNADRIRAMSDEKIEKWFWWMHKEMMRYTDSRVFLHDWLKQEVKE